ncbi:MAG: nucleotidyltransferase domain-containing protein [Desulfotomaculales bacterium]
MARRLALTGRKREKITRQLKHLLAKRREIIFAYLFGSFLTDPCFRDLDIGIYLREETVPRERALEYELSLGAELEQEIHYPVDVKVLNYAPVPLCHSVSGGEVIFSRNEGVRYDWVEKTWDMYLDMQYFLRNNLLDLLGPEENAGRSRPRN